MGIYYCTTEDNPCPHKEECLRYKDLQENPDLANTKLWTVCQGEKSKLFIKKESEATDCE